MQEQNNGIDTHEIFSFSASAQLSLASLAALTGGQCLPNHEKSERAIK